MQKAYINTLYDLIKNDKNVISCLSDSGTDYDEMLAREFPDQVINFGISENNKVAAASGLASLNKIPFVYTTGAFLSYRSLEFIRDDVCLQNRNVKLVGMGCGLCWSTLGPTHHSTEDISVLKSMPNLTLLSPCSPIELSECVKYAYRNKGPFYIRMGMSGEKEIFDIEEKIENLKNKIIVRGKDTCIFVTGSIINEVLTSVEELKKEGISVAVVDVFSLKPFDKESIKKASKKYDLLFSVEEHNVNGGLGSSIADVIAEQKLNVRLIKIGLNDKFACGYGTHNEILKINKLDSSSITKIVKKNLL